MNVPEITKKIFTKKTSDFTFTVLFFIIFSLFIVFAIKPSLTTAAALKKEEIDLQKIDAIYESHILNITTVQSLMEEYRDDFPLLTQAISEQPQVNKLIDDIKQIGDKNLFTIKRASIGEVNLLNSKNKTLQKLLITVEGYSTFENLNTFLDDLLNQRRLKNIQKINVSKENIEVASDSSQLKVIMDVEAYYL